ncbi:MAG: choline/carnitine O-acyltransferase, partial [Waddliaceae bacterium]
MPNLIMQDVPGTGTYSTTTPLEFPPGGGTGIGDTSGVSSAALREGNFLGNYLLWTGVFLSGIGSLYFVGKDKMLSLLLRDHYWAYHPTALRTKLQGLGVRFFSLKKTKTYSFQNNLPSLPVPDLEKTLQTYLNSVKPFLTEEEFCRTQSVVEEFKKGVGPELHKELVARAKTLRNWLESWWNEESYLSNRRSLAISSNWYGVGSTPDMIDYPDPQIGRASQTIKAMLQFKRMIDAETYEPWKVADTFPICMEQYKRLYGTCRIPGSPQDTIEVHPDSKHIIVFVKNWAYPLDLYNSKGEEITLEELDARLSAIRENAERRKEAPDEVSYLTSQDRDSWALDRQALLSDKDNAWSLKLIEEALFIVCLEDAAPENLEEHARAAFLGLDNRWYDAGMQMIIFRNGLVGSNMEHTGADATIPASMLKYVLDNEKDFGVRQDRVIPEKPLPPIPLRWDLPPDISSKIQAAKQAVKREMEDYDLRVLEFNSYGKSLIKTNHFSPDGFVQMALQLAYFKLNNSLALTYETAG